MKSAKTILLLIVLIGAALGVAIYLQSADRAAESSQTAQQPQPEEGEGNGPVRVEEKYGFTSEGIGG